MAADEEEGGGRPREAARYFCTAGRGMEAFLLREVRARLGATQVEYVSGKVFFTTSAGLKKLRKLKSAERLFLLLNKYPPLAMSRNKGKIVHDLQKLVNDNPRNWLDTLTRWRSFHVEEVEQGNFNQEYPIKRILEDEQNIKSKKQKTEAILEASSVESEQKIPKRYDTSEVYKSTASSPGRSFVEEPEVTGDKSPESKNCFTFRVSCRCSGALSKAFTAQELGRVIGVALMKNFGWKADLRNPDMEIFVHLNNIYSVIGIPVFRLPLAHRVYIKDAGLRSTIAWAMASLAELKAGLFALDPTCGLGTVLLEAATEWPNVHYLGTDISESQLHGAASNIKAAGLKDKIDLMKASVTALPLPSESIDVLFADIPFGKKFKITKDMMFLPAVFREIERVLRSEGTAVLLLSHKLFNYICNDTTKHSKTEICTESANNHEPNDLVLVESDTKEECSSPRSVSSSILAAGKENLSHERATLGSLVLIESFEVSLGRTDAFICKYKKVTTSSEKR